MADALIERDEGMGKRPRTAYEDAILREAGAKLRAARKAKGWTLRDLETALRDRGDIPLSFSALGAIENGKPATSLAVLCYLAEFLGMETALLLPHLLAPADVEFIQRVRRTRPEIRQKILDLLETLDLVAHRQLARC